jgi:hypothetical protein
MMTIVFGGGLRKAPAFLSFILIFEVEDGLETVLGISASPGNANLPIGIPRFVGNPGPNRKNQRGKDEKKPIRRLAFPGKTQRRHQA